MAMTTEMAMTTDDDGEIMTEEPPTLDPEVERITQDAIIAIGRSIDSDTPLLVRRAIVRRAVEAGRARGGSR